MPRTRSSIEKIRAKYAIHAESDGDLPDDPKVQLYAKGCQDVTLFRTLRINGQVMNRVAPMRTEHRRIRIGMIGVDVAHLGKVRRLLASA